jgi:hypothetical protein
MSQNETRGGRMTKNINIALSVHGRLAWEEEKKHPRAEKNVPPSFQPDPFPSPSPKDSRSAQRYLLNHLVAVCFCGTSRLRIREGKEAQGQNLLFTQRKK